MILDETGYKILHEREGLKLKPYLDTKGVPTIALGVTYYPNGKKVTMNDRALSLQEAKNLGKITADDFAKFVNSKVKTVLNQSQFNNLVSICYNIGKTAFSNSTFLRRVNIDPNDITIADGIAMWRKDVELWGRRIKELKGYFDYENNNPYVQKYIDRVIKTKLS